MKRRTWVVVGVMAAALAAVTVASARPDAAGSPVAAKAAARVSCKGAEIAFMGPLTGDAGFLGTEQLSWAKYAMAPENKRYKTKIKLLVGDTQLDPAIASSLGQKYLADSKVLAIIGPSTSGAVVATGAAFSAAKLVAISPSATRVSLTDGSIPSFFRVVPNDDVQGPSDANFMVNTLKAKKVFIIDDQETYSTGLADSTGAALKAKGVTVIRDSVAQSVTDFSSLVTKVPGDTNVVFLPWQQPARAQTFAQQMAEQGKRAKIFGSDGTNSPEKFKAKGAYVSNFAPDITGIPADKALVTGYLKAHPGEKVGSFGPPTYGAVQVALSAISTACKKGHGKTTRAAVLAAVPKVRISPWLLGGTFAFSKSHEPINAKFYIFEIQADGSYKLVG